MTDKTNSLLNTSNSIFTFRRMIYVFILIGFILLTFSFQLLFSKAKVTILAKGSAISSDISLTISNNSNVGDVPGFIDQNKITSSQSFPVTDTIDVGFNNAKFLITSTLPRPQTLVVKTRISAGDVVYRMVKTVVVSTKGEIEVEATLDSGSVPDPSALSWTIPGLNQETRSFFKVVYIKSDTTSSMAKIVTDANVNVALQVLQEKALTESVAAFRKKMGGKYKNDRVNIKLVSKQIVPKIGSSAESFSVSADFLVDYVAFNESDVNDFIKNKFLKSSVGDIRIGAINGLESLQLTSMFNNLDKAYMKGTVKIWETIAPSSEPINKNRLVGVSKDAAKRYLENVPGIASASIKITPFWLSQIPSNPERIFIEVR